MCFGISVPIQESDEVISDYIARVKEWMRLMQGAIQATQLNSGYIVDIIGDACCELEKNNKEPSKEEIIKLIKRVENALSHAKHQKDKESHFEIEESRHRSSMISRIEDEEINLARVRIENRMFRAPIILIPFALLIIAFGLAVLGVIDIRGQKIDVNNIVNEAVKKLTLQIDNEGNKALDVINAKLNEKTKEIAEFDVNIRIENEVSSHVANSGKNTIEIIKKKLTHFESQFPKELLSKTIQEVKDSKGSVSSLDVRIKSIERQLNEAEKLVTPLTKALEILKETDQNSFKTISLMIERAEWMIYAGVIGLLLGVVSFSLSIVMLFKHSGNKIEQQESTV